MPHYVMGLDTMYSRNACHRIVQMIDLWKPAFALLVLGSCLLTEKPSPDAERAVAAAEKQWQQAVLNGNRSGLASLMADDIIYTHSSSLTQTKGQFIESVVSGSTKYQNIEFKRPKCGSMGM
jgi:Domain of unknown function (DUF4440)